MQVWWHMGVCMVAWQKRQGMHGSKKREAWHGRWGRVYRSTCGSEQEEQTSPPPPNLVRRPIKFREALGQFGHGMVNIGFNVL